MNKINDDLYNDFWDWADSISIKYKNYEIKNVIITDKYLRLYRFIHIGNVNNINLRKILSYIKWKLKLHTLMNKIPKRDKSTLIKKNYNSLYYLSNKNLYVINISPDNRSFINIAPLAESDNCSLVVTLRNDVYEYFNKMGMSVILLNIYNPWRNEKDLKINLPLFFSQKKFQLTLDLFSLVSLSKSASLIDLLDIVTNENGLPKTLITLEGTNVFNFVFETYFKSKIPTVTLQHGKASIPNKNENNLYKYLISDWMIIFGSRQAEALRLSGIDFKKIKVLGSVKYDLYIDKIENKLLNNENRRILLGVQETMFYQEYRETIFINFIMILLSSKERYVLSIRFHPSILKRKRKKFILGINKIFQFSNVVFEVSKIEDPLEDISKSMVVFTSDSTLAMEAIILKKPVIEYLSSKRDDDKKFGDYRDFVLHASTGKDAEIFIKKLFSDKEFYNKIIKKQNKFINAEIMLPKAIPRILNFINSLNNNRRSTINNQRKKQS